MLALKVIIIKFISSDQPGFVECQFIDAWNKKHVVQDKVPIVTDKYLDANSEYPQNGFIACQLLRESKDAGGRTIFAITTAKPWGVDTVEGLTEFDLTSEQLTVIQQ